MPDGAECLTGHEAEEPIVPNGATGAQGHNGATARPAVTACVVPAPGSLWDLAPLGPCAP